MMIDSEDDDDFASVRQQELLVLALGSFIGIRSSYDEEHE
jgi:hypothetical protein